MMGRNTLQHLWAYRQRRNLFGASVEPFVFAHTCGSRDAVPLNSQITYPNRSTFLLDYQRYARQSDSLVLLLSDFDALSTNFGFWEHLATLAPHEKVKLAITSGKKLTQHEPEPFLQ